MLAACAAADDDRPRVEGEACYLAAESVMEAWEAHVGPVPARCREVLATYAIDVADDATLKKRCSGVAPRPGKRLLGCAKYGARVIVIDENCDATSRVDVAVHEWTHALDACVGRTPKDRDPRNDHADPLLWGTDDPGGLRGGGVDSVVGLARAHSAIGPCL